MVDASWKLSWFCLSEVYGKNTAGLSKGAVSGNARSEDIDHVPNESKSTFYVWKSKSFCLESSRAASSVYKSLCLHGLKEHSLRRLALKVISSLILKNRKNTDLKLRSIKTQLLSINALSQTCHGHCITLYSAFHLLNVNRDAHFKAKSRDRKSAL